MSAIPLVVRSADGAISAYTKYNCHKLFLFSQPPSPICKLLSYWQAVAPLPTLLPRESPRDEITRLLWGKQLPEVLL